MFHMMKAASCTIESSPLSHIREFETLVQNVLGTLFAVPAAEVVYGTADFLRSGRHSSSRQTAFVEFKHPTGTLHVYVHG